jgi:hypothetical protein
MPDPSGWTLDTLREHLSALITGNDKRYEQRFDASQKAIELGFSAQKSAVDAALAAADRAVIKAELAAEKRFESVNEFRGTLEDQQNTLMPRAEAVAEIKGINAKLDAGLRGLEEKNADLRKQIDDLLAERAGLRGGWGYAVGAVGLLLSCASLIALGFGLLR